MDHDEAADIVGWVQRKIKGWPVITAIMYCVLADLKTAKDAGYPGVYLRVHKATINALLARGWIYDKQMPDGTIHTITVSGERALRIFSLPVERRRTDGLCPVCCKRPKHVFSTGKSYGYCFECEKESKRRARALGRPRINPNRLCSRCHEQAVMLMSSGKPRTYCKECDLIKRAEHRQNRYKAWRERIDAGDPPLCYKCDQPVHYSETVVYDMCYEHYREYQNEYAKRRQESRRLK
jgi:hypothetical protein